MDIVYEGTMDAAGVEETIPDGWTSVSVKGTEAPSM